jgi:hypothetical protein
MAHPVPAISFQSIFTVEKAVEKEKRGEGRDGAPHMRGVEERSCL